MPALPLDQLSALLQVILVDLVMAGDNAIVIALAASGLPRELRRRAIVIGIVVATVLRIVFAILTVQLLQIIGLLLAGGLLLLWVAWKMWRELREGGKEHIPTPGEAEAAPRKTLRQAMWQIVIADVSMSLDNVLAVAGVARDHLWVLVVGLVLSIALMGAASTMIAGLLERHRWLAYIGLAVIAFVAVDMIYEGTFQVMHTLGYVEE